MSFTKVMIADIVPVDYNPRKISKKRFKRLQASIKEHTIALADWDEGDGLRFAQSVTINKKGNRIVGGHQRVDAMAKLGQDWIHGDDITWISLDPGGAQERALCLSLNDEEASGRWDDDKKSEVLLAIQEERQELFEKLDLSALTRKLKDKLEKATDDTSEELKEQKQKKAQFIDNVSFAVQEILEKQGDTIEDGYMFFTYKNRTHLVVQCNDEAYAMTKMVAELLKRDKTEINKFLTLAFRLGIEQSGWDEGAEVEDSYVPGESEECVE